MNKEDTAALVAAAGLMLLGLTTIIISEAAYINKLEAQLERKERAIRGYKRYYRDALDRLDTWQLLQHTNSVSENIKFESIIKDL